MAEHTIQIRWERNNQKFSDNRYSREHLWFFDGGIEVAASSSPQVVPLPYSNDNAVDPEEAFVASISSCHMLWFLSVAAKRGFIVDEYTDDAIGIMEKDTSKRLAITRVTLRPKVIFSGDKIPGKPDIHILHEQAHDSCFIANSVKTEIRCEPVLVP